MTRDELMARDQVLLEQARGFAEEVIAGRAVLPRDPRWGARYDPIKIMTAQEPLNPVSFQLALVVIRQAFAPEEVGMWGSCSECRRIFLAEYAGERLCSPECFLSYYTAKIKS
jgi:hypothetical protein